MKSWKNLYLEIVHVDIYPYVPAAGNTPPYMQATSNTRVAGAYMAVLVNQLKAQLGYSPANIHIIGHRWLVFGWIDQAVLIIG